MKTILGCVLRAKENNPATSLFDSPYHLLVSTDAAMLMNVAPDSFARALASMVFPHPGGPKSKTPFGAPSNAEDEKRWGNWRGNITDSFSDEMIGSRPPTSVEGLSQQYQCKATLQDAPANVTSMSSGCIISEAICPAIKVDMQAMHYPQTGLTFILVHLQVLMTQLLQSLQTLRLHVLLFCRVHKGHDPLRRARSAGAGRDARTAVTHTNCVEQGCLARDISKNTTSGYSKKRTCDTARSATARVNTK